MPLRTDGGALHLRLGIGAARLRLEAAIAEVRMIGRAVKMFAGALVLSVLVGTSAAPVWAGPASDDAAREAAKTFAVQAIEAINEKRWSDALDLLAQAEQKFHAPTHWLLMARCYAALERYVEAHEAYASLLVEQVPNYAPDAFHKAKASATSEIEQVTAKVARVRISASSAGGAPVTVHVDGQPVEPKRLAVPIAVAPGSHRIEATSPGSPPAVQTVTPAIGALLEVKLEVQAVGGDDPDPEPPSPPPEVEPEQDDSVPIGPVAVLVVGGAALATGTVLGVVTATKTSSIKEDCVDDVCPLEREGDADSAKLIGHLSTTMFIVGGVAAVAGATWLAIDLSDSDAAEQSAAVKLRVSPTGAWVTGSF